MPENSYIIGTFFSLSHYAVHKFRIPGKSICDKRSGRQTASIYYIVNGSVDFSTPSGKLSAGSGDILYIPKKQRYFAEWQGSPDIVFYGIDFGFEIKSEFGNVTDKAERFDSFILQKKSADFLSNPSQVFEKLYEQYCNPEEHGLQAVISFYSFFSALLSVLDKTPMLYGDTSVIENAAEYIEKHCTEDFYIEALAKLCNLSVSKFFHLFKEHTGLTPIEYKNTVRIRHAKRMLCEGKGADEISELLGFSTPAYFRKVFRTVTGMKPSAYKKNVSGYGEKKVLI